MKRRLDAELVTRGLSRSRELAREIIESGLVEVNGIACLKPARQVTAQDSVRILKVDDGWVSRGAYKLLSALEVFEPLGLSVADRVALDAGASTGGFTQVLLARGVSQVFAVDVGYGQLAWPLRTDDRVVVKERLNVRNLTLDDLPNAADVVVGDLSFISLKKVLPALSQVAPGESADFVLMVKPQFEVGRADVGDGVVRDPELRIGAVMGVLMAARELGLYTAGVQASGLPGPEGNVEYFVWLRRDKNLASQDLEALTRLAVAGGPQ